MFTSVIFLIIGLLLVGFLMNVKGIPGYIPALVVAVPALWVVVDLVLWISNSLYIPGLGWLLVIGLVVGGIGGGVNMTQTLIKHRSDERVTEVKIEKKK